MYIQIYTMSSCTFFLRCPVLPGSSEEDEARVKAGTKHKVKGDKLLKATYIHTYILRERKNLCICATHRH